VLSTVFSQLSTGETAAVVKEAAKLGWKPTFIVSAAAADRITLKLSGPAADGLLGVACGELPDSQRPGWKKYLERTKKYGKGRPGFIIVSDTFSLRFLLKASNSQARI